MSLFRGLTPALGRAGEQGCLLSLLLSPQHHFVSGVRGQQSVLRRGNRVTSQGTHLLALEWGAELRRDLRGSRRLRPVHNSPSALQLVSRQASRNHAACEWASQVALVVRSPPASAGDVGDAALIPGSGRSPGKRVWQPTPVFLPGEHTRMHATYE